MDKAFYRQELVDSDDGEDSEDWDTAEEEMDDDGEPHEDEPMSDSNANIQSVHITEQSTVAATVPEPSWTGYKIVGDNVDKNVRRSFQRSRDYYLTIVSTEPN